MKKLKKISLLVTTIALSTIFTGNVAAKIYPEYKIGDKITYKDMDFYVIEDSDKTKDSVTLLKDKPLTASEVNSYGIDENGVNHLNRYSHLSVGQAHNWNGYGAIAYYSSEKCGQADSDWDSLDLSGCANENATSYDTSDIKYIVDAWMEDKFTENELKIDKLGYKARLLTIEELQNNLGYEEIQDATSPFNYETEFVSTNPEISSWIYNTHYDYWTMSTYRDSDYQIWCVEIDNTVQRRHVMMMYTNWIRLYNGTVRPVITLAKTPIDVYYNIDTKTDNNGTIKTDKKQALEDEKVTISITPNEGYKLKSLKIYKTSDNEDVTSLVGYNSETNEFIMSDYDVTVSAEFEKIIENKEVIDNQNKIENPKTIDKISMYVIISVVGISVLIIFMIYKRKWNIK